MHVTTASTLRALDPPLYMSDMPDANTQHTALSPAPDQLKMLCAAVLVAVGLLGALNCAAVLATPARRISLIAYRQALKAEHTPSGATHNRLIQQRQRPSLVLGLTS